MLYATVIFDRDGVIVTVCILILLILAALLVVYIYRKRHKLAKHLDRHLRRRRSGHEPTNVYIGLRNNRPSGIIHALDESLALRIEDAKIESWRMKLGRIIGKGNFGEVHVGLLLDAGNAAKSQPVAIKTIRDMGSVSSVSEFLEEATVMHSFDHPNVLPLLGVVIANDRPFVIMPLMQNGDLRTFIAAPERSFTVRDLLEFGHQVAKGMAYLADGHFVHRDLAARNCMVDQALKVKIADFGLARDIYNKDYYRAEDQQRPLPVKWMAIEALQHSTFTTKSDVWSFGIVLWELMTRGVKPYADIDNVDLRRFLELGRRLEKPAVTPQCIYDLMQRCWQNDPDNRPSFAETCKMLDDILSEVINVDSPDYANHYMTMVDAVGERPLSDRYQRMSNVVSDEEGDATADETKPLNDNQVAEDARVV
ncbi:Hepatocyte growth factor receptor [Lamellibrachia satsuma]|nr:Hepatocyte growth factor receptor [Lamellibrachia satsuma]